MNNNKITAVNLSEDVTAIKVSNKAISDMTLEEITKCICRVIMMITLAVIVIVADFEKVIALLIFAGLVLFFRYISKI